MYNNQREKYTHSSYQDRNLEDTNAPGDQTVEFVRQSYKPNQQQLGNETDSSMIMAYNTSQFLNDTTIDADIPAKTEQETKDLERPLPVSLKTKKSKDIKLFSRLSNRMQWNPNKVFRDESSKTSYYNPNSVEKNKKG